MENQNVNQTQEQKQPQGWRDVVITPDMPLSAIVQFFNVLNQRLCGIEDNTLVEMSNGEKISITQAYQLQAEAEMAAQNRQEQTQESQGE